MILAVVSAFCLDFIAWKKGDKSYVFGAFPKKKKVVVKIEALDRTVTETLTQQGIAVNAIDKYQDKEGVFHFMIDLAIEKYKSLEAPLEQAFEAAKTSVSKKEQDETEEKKSRKKRSNRLPYQVYAQT